MKNKLSSANLIRLIYDGVSKNEANKISWSCDYCNKSEIHFHASSVGHCQRLLQYNLIYIKNQNEKKRFAEQEQVFLRDGHINENIVREGLKGSGIKMFYHANLEIKEPSMNRVPIVMHSDIVFEYEKEMYIIEQKSVKDTAWQKIISTAEVPFRYIWQLQMYLTKLEIKYGFILIKKRSSSDMMPFPQTSSKPLYKTIISKLANILIHHKKNKLIDKPYETKQQWGECRYCIYSKECWGE